MILCSLWRDYTQYLVEGVPVVHDIEVAKYDPPSVLRNILSKSTKLSFHTRTIFLLFLHYLVASHSDLLDLYF